MAAVAGVAAGPPDAGRAPGEELVERERLRQVVVRAGVQAGDPISDLRPRRQHEDRDGAAARAHPPTDAEAVDARHHPVQHDEVRFVGHDRLESVAAVGHRLDIVTLQLEGEGEGLPDRAIVFGNQHPRAHPIHYRRRR